jgi:hypothetical protein
MNTVNFARFIDIYAEQLKTIYQEAAKEPK